MDFNTIILLLADRLEVVSNLGIIYLVIKEILSYRKVRLETKKGDIVMRKRDVSPSSMTNAVSSSFYRGDRVDGETRSRIIKVTSPWYKAIPKEGDSTESN